jgi:protein TonB
MSPETILTSSHLDIIFDKRDKEYGAYQLRKNYPKRLYTSLGVMTSLVVAFAFFSNSRSVEPTFAESIVILDSTILTDVNIKPPKPLEPPVHAENRAIVKNTVPVIVKEAKITEVPETEEMEKKVIGAIDRTGNLIDEDITGPPASSGSTAAPVAEPPKVEGKEEVLVTADIMPEYPGGTEALRRFLSRNLRNPDEDQTAAETVRVVARFVVDKDGTITQVVFRENAGTKFEQEVMRVLKKMPKWKPGVFKGKAASVYFTLPVVFQTADQ